MVDAHRDLGEWPAQAIETHISVVVLVGDRAYKLFKPLRTAFIDNSTRQRRLANAHLEVELNRRVAPDVYLGVLDVLRDGEPVDHLVEMVRMPHHRRLSALLATEEGPHQLRRVARAVAAFHAAQPVTEAAAEAASHDRVAGRWWQNLDEMADMPAGLLDPERLGEVRRLAERYLEHRQALFAHRIGQGHARDGHGDLLAEDIFCLDDGPRILDCLAFDESLRVGDVLGDIAFLVMDVERLAGHDLARRLLRWYQEFSGEHHPASLAHHYVAYRALVRAKVTALRALQGGATPDEAASYLDQCHDHLRRAQVHLVVVGGGPGSGKSTLAEAIAGHLGAVVERSDELRKDLAGRGHASRPGDALDEGIYDPAHSRRTYHELAARARRLLLQGESVVLDARWSRTWQRQLARDVGRSCGARLVELECRLPADLARARIAARGAAGGDPSDASPELVDALLAQHEPWPEAIGCDTRRPVGELLAGVLAQVQNRRV
jgi:aminoglycoside phosphotransferase family enzyme/predicted kinase